MKALFITLVYFLFLPVIITGQTKTAIHTPTNVSVEAWIMPEASAATLAAWESQAAQWISDHGFSSYDIEIGPASATYNCHGYAWHKSDGGSTVWINQLDANNNPNVAKYWTGSTFTYSSSNQSLGTKVFLQTGDHSMITSTTNPGWYQSKWGNWPLYRHTLTAHPYSMTNPQYFLLNISGSTLICSSSHSTYSTINISSATYSWTGDYITISGSGSSVTGTGNGNGAADVKVGIASPYSGTAIHGMLSVWVGVFNSTVVTGTAAVCPNSLYTYTAQVPGGYSSSYSFSWTYPSGWYNNAQIQNMINLQTPMYNINYGAVRVAVTNQCGTPGYSGLTVYPGSGCPHYLTLYPNPASDNVTITMIDNSTYSTDADTVIAKVNSNISTSDVPINFTIRIYNSQGSLISSVKRNGTSFSVPLTNMRDGSYIIEVSDGKTSTTQTLIVKHN